ncbi:aldehyde dehydrogenase [Flavobacterium sp. MC2016-06]|uniref:aldehyde dehydrogenase n=1 Tax=Flavobacterium sp. MC2016-06 TaxID=2676308 RepID=UPI0012BAD867|nr:aldehyde dehydrogenase [Flavobacterium sp. MC2016-06]MBU3858510.1 aldehyde dehydrogenase [Flavobacterium sp. MC2016-06]
MIKSIKTQYDKLFIGGQWVTPSSNAKVNVVSPHDQSVTGYTVLAAKADVDNAVAIARKTFDSGIWSDKTPEERQEIITRFNEIHKEYAKEFGDLITAENGSNIAFTFGLQQALYEQTNAYLRAAKDFQWEAKKQTAMGGNVLIRREPVGVVAAIIPWNAPQQSALVKLIPALLAGCTVIFKPTPETALDGIALGELFKEAGLPDGVLSILPADREVSEYLVGKPEIDKIAFTGSTRAGQSIAATAGSEMKRFSLELGGKSAAIVLEDADINVVIPSMIYQGFGNNGQACIGLTRLLVAKSRYEEVTTALAEAINNIKVGDPTNNENFLGPVFNKTQFEKVNGYIEIGLKEGAEILAGGHGKPAGQEYENGWYIKPTLFVNANNEMRIAREEIFGPVVVAIQFDTEDEAIQIANDTEYGLNGGVFTANIEKGLEIARKIRTGGVVVNGGMPDFSVPFGGFKKSGVGREFGEYGLASFTEFKSIGY